MCVNKFKISKNSIGSTFTLPFNISDTFGLVNQTDVINTEFVNGEVIKAINPIVDHEKVRFFPGNGVGYNFPKIEYNLNFYNSDALDFSDNTWGSLNFSYEELYYGYNKFKKSFLRLTFYDTDNPLSQTPLFMITMFPERLINTDIDLNSLIRFTREDPLTNPRGFSEGFFIYFYKELVEQNYDLYMKADFMNAKDGKITPLMCYDGVSNIDNYLESVYLKYTLTKVGSYYIYSLDDTNDMVDFEYGTENKIVVNLFETKVV